MPTAGTATATMTITGAHVTHAARIEPKVTPGEIWTSESFAAQTAIASDDSPETVLMIHEGLERLAARANW